MLHGLKLAINGWSDKDLPGSDEGIAYANQVVTDLLKWFPQLQAALEENERTWCTLGYNMKKVASTAQEIYGEMNPMQIMLERLQAASAKVSTAQGNDFQNERNKATTGLRDFNECIRSLKSLQEECVQTLKNKVYYQGKVDAIRRKDTEKSAKKKVNDREAERRLRNEQKLTEVSGLLLFQSEKLSRELHGVLERKERVLETVLRCYIHTQNYNFANNPMPAVIASMPTTSSPVSALEGLSPGFSPEDSQIVSQHFVPRAPSFDQPPRAPSPTIEQKSYQQQLIHQYSAPTPDEARHVGLYPPASRQSSVPAVYAYGESTTAVGLDTATGNEHLSVTRPGPDPVNAPQTNLTSARFAEPTRANALSPPPPPPEFY